MVFDVNAFIGKWPYWPIPATSADEVLFKLSGWGIDRAAVCSTRSIFVNWQDGNCEVEAAVQAHPDRLLPFACLGTLELSHRAAHGRHDLASYRNKGFRGVRLYPQHHSYALLAEPFVDEICEQAAELAFPVLVSLRATMNWGVPSLDLGEIARVIERHPRVPWIVSGVNYLQEIRVTLSLIRRFPFVHLETSCVMGYAAIEKALNEIGHEQILFGSGAPLQHGRANLEKVLHAHISDAAQEAILYGNAMRLLRVEIT